MKHNHIAGRWMAGGDGLDNVNPSDTTDIVGSYAVADGGMVAEAAQAARAAFPAWARSTPQQRADILDAVGSELLARREELGTLLSREEGKILADGIAEVVRAAQVFKFFAGEALRIPGEKVASTRPGVEVDILREPVGVIGIITPWNFPMAIPAWKIAPALAYGNCVVFKPAELVPGSAWALAEIVTRAGVPAGVFNLVMGPGSLIGDALVDGVDAVTFTGSVATGRRVAQRAVGRMIRCQLEMGGKNPMVVLDDADLDIAVDAAVNGSFLQTGQRCTASSRLVVTEGIHDRFVAAVTERLERLAVGHALKPGTEIGPVVDSRQLEQDLSYIAIAEQEGARRRCGGQRLTRETPGFYLSPCLFTETTNAMRINREEVFGPVAGVIRVRDYDEALSVANDTPFGLSSGICTSSLKHATHFRANSAAGLVMVNLPTAGLDFHVPFGGRKGSSYGPREQGRYAVEFYTSVKTAYVRAG
ncbi:aldehyde dehydrogenase family protein [Azospirillum melinis]|uniref:Aldehyde dehydrogenase family protein n=1 Tax=Azospirillum melinis TaxID=328839 RepID=A0ABX2KA16_9PROT|nr:aldehyde dehydrogenase family protein [Azospirillum melinis]MBP2307580.1 aldehyde dehydrogenase (NAD+) [Azospirillum melinis]NUB00034.1 aldehyde dehydrogenase family protein [Azospirillum melinis]